MKRRGRSSRARKGPKQTSNRHIIAYDRALRVLSLMRSKQTSLTRAARETKTTPRTVIRHAGKAITKAESGRYRAKPSDRLARSLNFITTNGTVGITVRGSRLASTIAKYSNAVQRYLETGQTDELEPFVGKSIQVGKTRYPFVTDTRLLNRLGRAGEVSFEDLYAHSNR
jgi:hypothetical protein